MNRNLLLPLGAFALLIAGCDRLADSPVKDPEVDASYALSAARAPAQEAPTDSLWSLADLALGSDAELVPGSQPVGGVAVGGLFRVGDLLPDTVENLDTAASIWTRAVTWQRPLGGWSWTSIDTIFIDPTRLAGREVEDIGAFRAVSHITATDARGTVRYSEIRTIVDGDGDGLAFGNAGEEGRFVLEVQRRNLLRGVQEYVTLTGHAGEDHQIIAGDDNRMASLRMNRLRGTDTVATAWIRPDSGQQWLVDPARIAPSRFVVDLSETVGRIDRTVRLVGEAQDGDTVIIGARGTRTFERGRIESWTLTDTTGALIADPDALVRLTVEVEAPAGDSVRNATWIITVDRRGTSNEDDDRIVAMSMEQHFARGPLTRATFNWSGTGVRAGTDPRDGRFAWTASLRDGRAVSFEGAFTVRGPEGTFTAPDGSSTTVSG